MQMIQAVVMLLSCRLRSLPGVAWRRIHKNQCMRHPRALRQPHLCPLPDSRLAALYLGNREPRRRTSLRSCAPLSIYLATVRTRLRKTDTQIV